MMYWPSSVGAIGKTVNVSSGKSTSGVNVPAIWTASRNRIAAKPSAEDQPDPDDALPGGEDGQRDVRLDGAEGQALDRPRREELRRAEVREELQDAEPQEDDAERDPDGGNADSRQRAGDPDVDPVDGLGEAALSSSRRSG